MRGEYGPVQYGKSALANNARGAPTVLVLVLVQVLIYRPGVPAACSLLVRVPSSKFISFITGCNQAVAKVGFRGINTE